MPKYVCQHCNQHIEVPDSMAGGQIACPNCGKMTALGPGDFHEFKPPKLDIGPITKEESLPRSEVAAIAHNLISNIERVVVGKRDQVVLAVAALFAEGHLLVEDVPGVAKTMIARALAISSGCSFKRIQCTPDLQPSDVLGESSSDRQTGQQDFRFGPLFAHIILVDEINRASPRTQAALLEAMGESSITAGKVTYPMVKPFMVIATQNPIEQEGTFLLPEAQKDRFLVRLSLGYPSFEDEKQMCERFQLAHPIESLKPVTRPDRIEACQQAVRETKVSSEICDYILALVRATREHPALLLGASPRASLGLYRISQAIAAIHGEDSASASLVKTFAKGVLLHRLILRPERKDAYPDSARVVGEILAKTPAPGLISRRQ